MPSSLPSPRARWAALAALSLAMFASSYIYDSLGPMAKLLSDQRGFSNADIGLLQAMCSLPGVFMVLPGGLLLDRIGVKKAGLAFACLCLAGAGLVAAATGFPAMLAGRLVFGLGISCLSVAGNKGIARWFDTRRLGLVFGLSLTISRLGSLAAQTSPAWAPWAYGSWRLPLLLAAAVGVLCLVAMGAYWAIEAAWPPAAAPPREASTVLGAGRLGRAYTLTVLVCVTFYACIFPFQTFAQKFFVEGRGTTPGAASLLVGALTVVAMVATPFCGLLADRFGRRTLLLAAGCLLLVPAFPLMLLPGVPLLLPMLMMGLAFSLVPAVLWPAVMLIVPQERLGFAFGLMTMVQGLGLTGFNFLVGWTNDLAQAGPGNPAGYQAGMGLFACSALVALLLSWILHRHERGPQGHGLGAPSIARTTA